MSAHVIDLPTHRGPAPTASAALPTHTPPAPPTAPHALSVTATDAEHQALRGTFGRLPSGICVITTDGIHGPHGMTASAVCSLSLEPPLLLVCVDNRSATLRALTDHGTFAVNVLATHQSDTSSRFASRTPQQDRFAQTSHTRRGGQPVLDGAAAWMLCDLYELLPGGDHTIVVGCVQASGHSSGEPLVWHNSAYRHLRSA